ncbi:MAG: glycosyltransferase, partial [Chloroflexota bacterium]
MTQLTISILVHEDFSHIHTALKSILQQTKTLHEIYVVINAGSDENIQALQEAFPDLHYILNETPQGFAANHNQV